MAKIYGRLEGSKTKRVLLATVTIEDAQRIKREGVYRTFRGDYREIKVKPIG